MDARARQFQFQFQSRSPNPVVDFAGGDRRFRPPHLNPHVHPPLPPLPPHPFVLHGNDNSMKDHHLGIQSTRYPSAPVPLEPWDREAIMAYRNRVNANSTNRAAVIDEDHEMPIRGNLHRAMERPEAISPTVRRQDYRDWPAQRFRESHHHHHHQVRGNLNPNPILEQNSSSNVRLRLNERFEFEKISRKRSLEEDDDGEFMRRRPKFVDLGFERTERRKDAQFDYSPQREMFLPPPPPVQSRVKWQQSQSDLQFNNNFIDPGDQRKMVPETESIRYAGNSYGSALPGSREFPIRAESLRDEDDMAAFPGFSKGKTMQTPLQFAVEDVEVVSEEDELFPQVVKEYPTSAATGAGLHQLEKPATKAHNKGKRLGIPGNMSSKNQKIIMKNKTALWDQPNKKKLKRRRNPLDALATQTPGNSLASVKEGRISQNGSVPNLRQPALQGEQSAYISEAGKWNEFEKLGSAQCERNTADLSVVFGPSGMIAQEVVTSEYDTLPEYRTNSSSSKGFVQVHSLPREEIEEQAKKEVIDSQGVGLKKNGSADNLNVGSQTKTRPMNIISETISCEKGSILEADSFESSSYVEELDDKNISLAMQSKDRAVVPLKRLLLDCGENDTPASTKVNPVNNGPTTMEFLFPQGTSFASSDGKAIDMINFEERPQKKLRVEQTDKHAITDSEKMEHGCLTPAFSQTGIEATGSQGPLADVQLRQDRTLGSQVTQETSRTFPTQSSQPDNKFSQNPISASSLPQGRPSTFGPPIRTKGIANQIHATRPRTWHRTGNVIGSCMISRSRLNHYANASGEQVVAKVENSQSAAYVRKGNSLVRASGSSIGFSSTVSDLSASLNANKARLQKSSPIRNLSTRGNINNIAAGSGTNAVSTGPFSATAYGSVMAVECATPALERPRTPPLAQTVKFPVCVTSSPQSSAYAALSSIPPKVHLMSTDSPVVDAVKISIEKVPNLVNKSVEIQVRSVPSNNLSLCRSNLNEDQVENVTAAQVIYLKRKSNQLIAAPTCKLHGSTASISEGSQSPSNGLVQDHYYKRKKNQLVRSSLPLDTKTSKASEVPGTSCFSGTKEMKVPRLKTQQNMAVFQTKLGRVLKQKKHCILQSSRVWTLSQAQHPSSLPLLQSKRVVPLLFPWKRPSYGRSVRLGKIKAVPDYSKGSSLSLMSKKLKRLLKRDTVYTKSLDGFSLRRSGVLSLGGSNLKWTKSLEKRSKEANEEATIAVAAAEKKKREEKAIADVVTGTEAKTQKQAAKAMKPRARKSREITGERIVRVGLFRYKMDPSKRTLQRIPDEESTSSVDASLASQTINTAKIFTPKRVSIGGNQYLRVGNGNQLVRDPKTISRALASEKVRWSLHTARCRLAKKQQYCQFFTRFGKCDKEGGKCPYIHDREKVAVCTKFLRGTCSNVNCELTHKIMPERMEDCSYFLQGYCTHENCPYRHVNVNPKASVCDGFLKGYCAEGDKCNKKHTYVCPQYAATGECKERLTCKLHHPKKKDKPKVSSERKGGTNTKRRYFVAGDFATSESASALFSLHCAQTALEMPSGASECLEFISLDASGEDENNKESIQGALGPMERVASDFLSNLGLPADDMDSLIKPIRLFRK